MVYALPKPGPLGQTVLALTPLEFLDRLAALVPPCAAIAIGITACSPYAPIRAAVTSRAGLPMEGPVPERSLNAPLQAPAAAGTEKSRSPSAYQ